MQGEYQAFLARAFSRLRFGFSSRVPLHLQAERAECGLACLAMVAGYHGRAIDLSDLRARHPVSERGMTAMELCALSSPLGLMPRTLRAEVEELEQLALPAVLHWDMKHFVVLAGRRGGRWLIHDPAIGAQVVSCAFIAEHFTGVAIEFTPTLAFETVRPRARKSPLQYLEHFPGLGGLLVKIIGLGLALEFLGLLGPLASQFVVDQAIVSMDMDLVMAVGVGLALVLLSQVLLQAYRSWVVSYASTQIALYMGGSVFHHLLALPLGYFRKRSVGDIASRFDSLATLQRTLTTGLVEALLDGAMALGALFITFLYSRLFGLLAVGTLLAYWALRYALIRRLRQVSDMQISATARRQTSFLESLRAIQCIQLHGRQDLRLGSWLNASVDEQNALLHVNRYAILFKSASTLLFGADGILFLSLGAAQIMAGQFSVGMLLAVMGYKSQFAARATALIDKGFEWRLLSLHLRRIADIVETPPQERRTGMPLPATLEPSIELNNLGFRYSEGEPWVFRGLQLTIRPGESVTLIGPSGAGKSTLVKLLVGALEPTEGSIAVGGIPLRHIRQQAVGSYLCAVMQDDQLLSGSLLENITFFSDRPDFEHVISCARVAQIHDDILDMPMGYQTLLGEVGGSLSGGQRQRLLIARALYARPRILILDEATANVDIFTERQITRHFKAMGMTRIVVAHRKETAFSTDRQVRLNEMVASAEQSHPVDHTESTGTSGRTQSEFAHSTD